MTGDVGSDDAWSTTEDAYTQYRTRLAEIELDGIDRIWREPAREIGAMDVAAQAVAANECWTAWEAAERRLDDALRTAWDDEVEGRRPAAQSGESWRAARLRRLLSRHGDPAIAHSVPDIRTLDGGVAGPEQLRAAAEEFSRRWPGIESAAWQFLRTQRAAMVRAPIDADGMVEEGSALVVRRLVEDRDLAMAQLKRQAAGMRLALLASIPPESRSAATVALWQDALDESLRPEPLLRLRQRLRIGPGGDPEDGGERASAAAVVEAALRDAADLQAQAILDADSHAAAGREEEASARLARLFNELVSLSRRACAEVAPALGGLAAAREVAFGGSGPPHTSRRPACDSPVRPALPLRWTAPSRLSPLEPTTLSSATRAVSMAAMAEWVAALRSYRDAWREAVESNLPPLEHCGDWLNGSSATRECDLPAAAGLADAVIRAASAIDAALYQALASLEGIDRAEVGDRELKRAFDRTAGESSREIAGLGWVLPTIYDLREAIEEARLGEDDRLVCRLILSDSRRAVDAVLTRRQSEIARAALLLRELERSCPPADTSTPQAYRRWRGDEVARRVRIAEERGLSPRKIDADWIEGYQLVIDSMCAAVGDRGSRALRGECARRMFPGIAEGAYVGAALEGLLNSVDGADPRAASLRAVREEWRLRCDDLLAEGAAQLLALPGHPSELGPGPSAVPASDPRARVASNVRRLVHDESTRALRRAMMAHGVAEAAGVEGVRHALGLGGAAGGVGAE